MNNNTIVVAKSGFSLGTLVFLLFLILKLAGLTVVATWSWLWVTSPLWIPFALGVAVHLLVGGFFLLALILKAIFD